jgi:hypothetical protein
VDSASEGYRSGQLQRRQQEHAHRGAVRKTCCWGSTKACIMPKHFIFPQTLIE